MDPLECLLRARDAISDGDSQEAWDSLDSFREWRALGGFDGQVPAEHTSGMGDMTGDKFYEYLTRRYVNQLALNSIGDKSYNDFFR